MVNRNRKGRRTFGETRRLPSGRWQAVLPWPDGTCRVAPQTFARGGRRERVADDHRDVDRRRRLASAGTRARDLRHRTAAVARAPARPSAEYRRTVRHPVAPMDRADVRRVPLGALTPERFRRGTSSGHRASESTQPGKAYRLARAMLNTAVDDGVLRSNPCRVKGAGREELGTSGCISGSGREDRRGDRRPLPRDGAPRRVRLPSARRARRPSRGRIDVLHRRIVIEEQAVELAGGRIVFGPPKTAAGRRTVAVPVELVELLEEHLAEYVGPEAEALVFTSPEGHPLRRTKFRARWAEACGDAEITGCTSTTCAGAVRRGRRTGRRCGN